MSSPRERELEKKIAFLTNLLEQQVNDPQLLECIVQLGVLAIKLNAMAWGEYSALVLDDLDLVSKASTALDHLLEQREQMLVYIQAYREWEFHQESKRPAEKKVKEYRTPFDVQQVDEQRRALTGTGGSRG